MKVMLKLTLDCSVDAAWRALQSPAVFREVSAPLMKIVSLEEGGFPTTWPEGKNRVEIEALGLVPMGRQVIDIDRSRTQHPGVRIIHDKGYGASGSLKLFTTWDHRMAVSADPYEPGKTLYRDRLVIGAGALTPALWAGMWAFWQLRGVRLQQLAPTWSFEPKHAAAVVDEVPADVAAAHVADANVAAAHVAGADDAAQDGGAR
ncbi:hypothetical protein B7R54_13545 [Subtercola boreus]|uniref:SRPBCC family protein n=1 Tax=Subtercola boreus TaxID=120213 RepID=A0A3E0VL21_9MICO|nr:hypothetical protein [Subtercola boreus]RFA10120.1 hypothetical protein B7R54_13545 [Subtercola boreus]TQL52723.1 hypothetical protein FB464_0207 [Subtercola boreus]